MCPRPMHWSVYPYAGVCSAAALRKRKRSKRVLLLCAYYYLRDSTRVCCHVLCESSSATAAQCYGGAGQGVPCAMGVWPCLCLCMCMCMYMGLGYGRGCLLCQTERKH